MIYSHSLSSPSVCWRATFTSAYLFLSAHSASGGSAVPLEAPWVLVAARCMVSSHGTHFTLAFKGRYRSELSSRAWPAKRVTYLLTFCLLVWSCTLGRKQKGTCHCLEAHVEMTLGWKVTGSLSIWHSSSCLPGATAHTLFSFLRKANSKLYYQDSEYVLKIQEWTPEIFHNFKLLFSLSDQGNALLRVETSLK